MSVDSPKAINYEALIRKAEDKIRLANYVFTVNLPLLVITGSRFIERQGQVADVADGFNTIVAVAAFLGAGWCLSERDIAKEKLAGATTAQLIHEEALRS